MEPEATKTSPTHSKPPTHSSASSIHSNKQPNGESTPTQHLETEEDPQIQLIETLRTQLTDTHNQLSQLNSKLVQSYDRVSHLEDTLEFTSNSLNTAKTRITELESAQAAHEAALETGVLVEREHVAHELSRLMERATEEAAQRGVADAARSRIETELDDLSADLFARANTMVAEARIARAASERKVEEAENALKSAEEAVKSMQMQMQQMADARKADEMKVAEMRAKMSKGKWVERDGKLEIDGPRRRLYNNHATYREFIAFVSHLRGLRATAAAMPQLSTLTSLPFVARLIVEDCDQTLRLDLAPALNWLNRRAVHSAVLQGQLEIEPVYGLQEIECALCGSNPITHSLPGSVATSPTASTHLLSSKIHHNPGSGTVSSWASSTTKYFKGTLTSPTTSPQAQQHPVSQPSLHRIIVNTNAPPIYTFRVANAQTNPGAAPLVLCSGGWCLARLRTTCELCAFLKRGVIEKVWSEPPQPSVSTSAAPSPHTQASMLSSVVNAMSRDKDSIHTKEKDVGDAPPVPPRRRQLSQLGSSIWGAFGGSRSGSRSGTPGPDEPKEAPPQVERRLPPPLPPAPADTKLTIVPPPPPPRARPVPPIPSRSEPEGHERHEDDHEPQEPVQHAMVFDATADEHGHHALSPTADKRHSIPITLHQPLRPILPPKSPTDTLATLPESTTASDAHHPATELASEGPTSAINETATSPLVETEAAPATDAEKPSETLRSLPPVSRPPRARPLAQESGNSQPMSPGGVPLPDSRPVTPVANARGASPSRVRTPSPNRMRATSPTLTSTPPRARRTGSIRRDAESIRGGSPAPGSPGRSGSVLGADGGPPKIPRRAPRRVAPVPPGTPSKTGATEPATQKEKPEIKDEKEKTDEGDKAVDAGQPEAVAQKSDATEVEHGDDKPNLEEGKPEIEKSLVEDEGLKDEGKSAPRLPPRRAVPPAPPLPARARAPKPAKAVEYNEEIKKPEDNNQDEGREEAQTTEPTLDLLPEANVSADSKENLDVTPSTTLATIAASTTNGVIQVSPNSTLPQELSTEKASEGDDDTLSGRKEAEDDGQFVGDQSWEERAYKEIVKLKEDMFWARIGSTW
ncbi:GDP/GTP exchange factor Sec2p [Ceratobasidium theobromae]|uniref:GDP/GTP exchange factor Sec2p n=1 Tax=Ceratobasidium theobromae TaxID=1582974 RepID=A0A5N5QL38_9AGAM|nr:GDP/GTP exchange factor Sec2p [Ceratobasidium theobromae]